MRDAKATENYVLGTLSKSNFSAIAIDVILDAYKEEHRRYHTLEHIECMLKTAHKPEEVLVTAVAYHDLIYSSFPVPPGKNELYSLEAVPSLGWHSDIAVITDIQEAILATAFYYQTQTSLSPLSQELCDLDLANLAFEWEEYCYWSELAMEEASVVYKNLIKEPIELKLGQCLFINKMLKRSKLYYHHTEWEEPARKNLTKRRKLIIEEFAEDDPIAFDEANIGN